MLHSFVGLAAVLVGYRDYARSRAVRSTGVEARIHEVEIYIGVFIGAVTFTGSVIAFGKLQGVIGSKPLLLPGRHLLNLAARRWRASCSACMFVGARRARRRCGR